MSYRDDLEAAVRRAEAAERELERAREADRQKITILETKLEDARRALARREPPAVPVVPVRARAEWQGRTIAGMGLSVAGLAVGSVIASPALFAVAVAVGVATIYDRGRLTAGRELLDRFFTQLRTGKYELAHGIVHRVSRASFSRFCNQIEGKRLGVVRIRTDRFLRRGARCLDGMIQVDGADVTLAATIDRDHSTGDLQIARVELGLSPAILLAPEVPES